MEDMESVGFTVPKHDFPLASKGFNIYLEWI